MNLHSLNNPSHFKLSFCLVAALFLVACNQEPASVVDRGGQFFGRDRDVLDSPYHQTYPVDSPRYKDKHSAEQAPVSTVGVSELPPPKADGNHEQMVMAASTPHAPATAISGKFVWPVAGGKVISHFGPKPGGKANDGINIAVAEGEPIWASASGMVVYAGNELKGYGNMVIIRHDGGWMTAYAHARSISVKKNDYVKQSEIIGYVGITGGVKTPQLHFALRDGKTPVDPEQYLPSNVAGQ